MTGDSKGPQARRLLATKLDPPVEVYGLVPRSALVARLTQRHSRLTLVDAPAGWGKSSLISEWFNSDTANRAFAFLRLGPEDDDPTSFWAYASAAISRIVPDWEPEIDDALRAPGIDATRTLVPNIINALHDHNQPVVIVLDDYHTIADSEVHRSVAYLIDNAPRCLHVVISTRIDPPLPVASYRAAGTITEIRVKDLRLSPTETQLLVQQRFGISLSNNDATVLCERTEGWPAGIQLAALSLAADNTTTGSAFIAGFAGDDRNVADYLTTEVLKRQPEQRRQFLLATSLLEEFNADLCDDLLQTTDSAAMVQEIEDHNLFLVPLDSRREWFRYHHLLRDWLRHLHRTAVDPEVTMELQRRAANWLLDNGFVDRAIEQLLDAGDLDQAAQQMNTIAALEPHRRYLPVRRWIESVTDELAHDKPALALARVSWLRRIGDGQAEQHALERAERAIDALDPSEERYNLTNTATMHRGLQALRAGDLERAVQTFEAFLNNAAPAVGPAGIMAQGLLGVALFWNGSPEAALPHIRQSAADRRRFSIPDFALTSFLAATYAELGRWDESETAATDALSMTVLASTTYPSHMAAHYAMAEVHHHRSNTAEAIKHADQGLEQATGWNAPELLGWGYYIKAQLVEDPTQQRELLTDAKQQTLASDGKYRLLNRIEAAVRRTTQPPRTRGLPNGMILDPLTPRELDVLRLLRGDLTVREIGNELNITHNTTKGYTKTIYQKLAVTSRADAITTATAADLI